MLLVLPLQRGPKQGAGGQHSPPELSRLWQLHCDLGVLALARQRADEGAQPPRVLRTLGRLCHCCHLIPAQVAAQSCAW